MNKLMIEIAKAVLRELVGPGGWKKTTAGNCKPIENPLLGLTPGDTVYSYNEDNSAVELTTVVWMWGQIGLYVSESDYWGPQVWQISAEDFARTEDEAIKTASDLIQADLTWNQERVNSVDRLKEYLNRIGASHDPSN